MDVEKIINDYNSLIEKIQFCINEVYCDKYTVKIREKNYLEYLKDIDATIKYDKYAVSSSQIRYTEINNKIEEDIDTPKSFRLKINGSFLEIYYLEEPTNDYEDEWKYELENKFPIKHLNKFMETLKSEYNAKKSLIADTNKKLLDLERDVVKELHTFEKKKNDYKISLLSNETFDKINKRYAKYYRYYTGDFRKNNEHFIYDKNDKKIKLVSDTKTIDVYELKSNTIFYSCDSFKRDVKYREYNILYEICKELSLSILLYKIDDVIKEDAENRDKHLAIIEEKRTSLIKDFYKKIKKYEIIINE